MADIILKIPNDKIDLVVSAFCDTQGYQAQIENEEGVLIPNPETPAVFAKKCIAKYIKTIVLMYERKQDELLFNPTDVAIT